VATDRGALPEVVGDAGTFVPYGDVEATAEAVRRALDGNGSDVAARRIRDRFPLEARRNRLHAVVDALLEEV
jgi:glycosyltransferase involved in cell wall biosynthesis